MTNREYQPIENYAIIGDLNTVALVGLDGSIDFMCFPYFDSPSIFAAMLDADKGGYFQIKPVFNDMKTKQLYLPDTNVLLTRFLSSEGVGEITDFMPVEELYKGHILVRRITNIRGTATYRMNCCPRFNYAHSPHQATQEGNNIIFASEGFEKTILRLRSTVPLKIVNGDGYAEFTLHANERADFLLELVQSDKESPCEAENFVNENLLETVNYWRDWMSHSKYEGRWMEIVNRSALVLKLLTSYKYGSIVAAPTFSLPEELGGERNWDYRYTWIRDASFTLYALISLGYTKEATCFMKWVEELCQGIGNTGHLNLMYSIDGRKELREIELDHLEGYKKSSPVRIGNGAYDQLQLDIYGELMDAVYLYNKYGEPISHDFWKALSYQINWVCDNWKKKDEGIWEVRGGKRNFLYSIMMCWVAVDRAIKLAQMRSFPMPDHWIKERDTIYNFIFDNFWNKEKQTFVQSIGATAMDASVLLMPMMRFISPKDPRWLSTLKALEEELVSDSLVYRYRPGKAASDGLEGGEGTFSMCTFWYVECLARSGQVQKARFYFEKMLGYANHVGLYAEQLGFRGEHLGNFPQAFTHLGLISAALSLNAHIEDERNKDTGKPANL